MTDAQRRGPQCLDSETLAAFIDGRLNAEERVKAEAHLADCEDCYEALVESSGLATELTSTPGALPVPARPSMVKAGSTTRVVIGLALAASLAGMLWWSSSMFMQQVPARPELVDLVAAVGNARFTEARVAGGFEWGPVPAATRGAESQPSPEVKIAAARLEQNLRRERSVRNLGAFAVSRLTVGEVDAAIDALEEAVGSERNDPALWNDMAAAYLMRSSQPGRAADLPRALEAAETATSIGTTPEAWFNKALVLERLHQRALAIAAWEHYLTIDSASPWAEEARAHLAELKRQSSAPPVSDAQMLRDELFTRALPSWALLKERDATEEPAAWLHVQKLTSTIDELAADTFARDVVSHAGDAVRDDVSAARGYIVFAAAMQQYRKDEFETAQTGFVEARTLLARARSPLALLASLHEGIVLYRLRNRSAAEDTLRRLGTAIGSRRYPSVAGRIEWILGVLSAIGARRQESATHYAAALSHFADAREPANAAFVHSLFATHYDQIGDPVRGWQSRLTALRHQATTAFALGQIHEARGLLAEARAIVDANEGATWDRMRAETDLGDALTATGDALPSGIEAASRALHYFQREAVGRLPEMYMARARLLSAAGRTDDALRDLTAGIDVLARTRQHIASGVDQATFSDTVRLLVDEFVALHYQRGSPDDAFAATEQARARDLTTDVTAARPDLRTLAAGLPGGVVIADFVVGNERSFVWLIRRNASRFVPIDLGRDELARLVSAVTPPRLDAVAGGRLGARLLGPLEGFRQPGDLLVIVPDGPLHALPFAALPLGRSRYLIEEHALLLAPSVTAWTRGTHRLGAFARAPREIHSFGNPPPARPLPTLPTLPGAEAEARTVAAHYARPIVLTGAHATRAALVNALTTSEVVHFAGHALVNVLNPNESELMVPDASGTGLTAGAIRKLSCRQNRLVVLAACQTTAGLATRSEGPLGLARALLAAGVPSVVASHWMVDDVSSRELFTAFHASYVSTGSAARAMQAAQRAAIAAGRGLEAWAGFVVIGGDARELERSGRTPEGVVR